MSSTRAFLALAAIALIALPVSASAWPPTSVSSFSIQNGDEVEAVAFGPRGDVYVLASPRLERYSGNGTFLNAVLTGASGVFRFAKDLAVDADGVVYVADTYASRIQRFTENLTPLPTWASDYPEQIAVGPTGTVFVKTPREVQVLSAGGDLLDSWKATGSSALAIEPDGNIVLAGYGLFRRYRPDGKLLDTVGGRTSLDMVRDLVADDVGLFLHTGDDGILAFDHDGIYRGGIWSGRVVQALTRDLQGRLVVVEPRGILTRFSPVTSLPPAPPPPPGASSAVILHIGVAGEIATACQKGPVSLDDVVTVAEARREGGANYFVYLLAQPRSASEGLAGIQCGIEHDDLGHPNDPLRVHDWTACSDLEFPQDAWPAPGSGNTLTWAECDFSPLVVGGYFFVTAYGPSTMEIAPYPEPPQAVKTSNCNSEEEVVDQILGPERVGWVSLGGGAIGLDTDGCNPGLEPCASITVPVEPTTWGKLKSLYGNPR